MKIVHAQWHSGIPSTVWVRYLTNSQLKREIRRILKRSLNLDRATNPKLNLLLTEAEQRAGLKDWLARCQELLTATLEATAAWETSQADETNTITRGAS